MNVFKVQVASKSAHYEEMYSKPIGNFLDIPEKRYSLWINPAGNIDRDIVHRSFLQFPWFFGPLSQEDQRR